MVLQNPKHQKKKKKSLDNLCLLQEVSDSDDDDDSAKLNNNQHPMFEDCYVEDGHKDTECTAGIVWLTSKPGENAFPWRITFLDDKLKKNLDKAISMHAYICEKCAPLNPTIFSSDIMENWREWFASQQFMWSDPEQFILTLDVFEYPSPFNLPAQSDVIAQVIPSERPELPPGTELIVHQSGNHGAFSKSQRLESQRKHHLEASAAMNNEVVVGTACIYKWREHSVSNIHVQQGLVSSGDENASTSDSEGSEYLWVGIVHRVEGNPATCDCMLEVRWCPNDRNKTWRNKITPDDTFDQHYCKSRGPTSKAPYVALINKQSCLAFNLKLTKHGKFDNRERLDEFLGSTSKEVASDVLKEFYAHNC